MVYLNFGNKRSIGISNISIVSIASKQDYFQIKCDGRVIAEGNEKQMKNLLTAIHSCRVCKVRDIFIDEEGHTYTSNT